MALDTSGGSFRPALIVVDFQEDFCPPHGSLAVPGGRDIAPAINELVNLPFVYKIATQDWHPQNHVSFASNHTAPDNKPFESVVTVKNPLNDSESEDIKLWPDHCVQDTFGATLIPEFDSSKLDLIVKKGQDHRVEMYSAFRDTFTKPCVSDSNLSSILKERDVSHVYVCGLSENFCVKHTATHAAGDGFTTYVITDATATTDPSTEARAKTWQEMKSAGVSTIELSGDAISMVRHLSK